MTANFRAAFDESAKFVAQGRYEQALALTEHCLQLEPDDGAALAQRGALLLALRRPAEARASLERARALQPNRADVLNNLGSALVSLGRGSEAIACFTQALALVPDYLDARYNLAGALSAQGAHAEAAGHYAELLARSPDSAPYHAAYARALLVAERLDEGIAELERAVAIDPQFHDAIATLGNALLVRGRTGDAVAMFERAVELAPQRSEFYLHLAQARPSAISGAHVLRLESLASNEAALDDDSFMAANFALGRAREDRGEHVRAFQHFARANARKRGLISYDERETAAAFERIASTFTAGFLEARRACSYPASWPVFIFGMPRSGTTLVEQILASHARVFGSGELTLFEDASKEILTGGAEITPEAMASASCDALRTIGMLYANRLRVRSSSDATRITDKLTANFRYAGLISIVLPHARMIHVRRDPVDTCLSIFTNYFAGDLPFAYDLAELGRYYRGYERLMHHWREVLPAGAMLEVQYEDVVADLETQARRIVAYCGLEWDPACLEFHSTDRPVRTASSAQVRRPIYTSSVGYSHAYGDLLKPLTDALRGV